MGSPRTLDTRDIFTHLLTPAEVRKAIDISCVTLLEEYKYD